MSQGNPNGEPAIRVSKADGYREGYANSVQVRMSVWDFLLVFGTMRQNSAADVDVENFQCVYLSPQQAKALWNILGQNLAQYEQAFGQLQLEPIPAASTGAPVN